VIEFPCLEWLVQTLIGAVARTGLITVEPHRGSNRPKEPGPYWPQLTIFMSDSIVQWYEHACPAATCYDVM
jgi:hypothetical protein